MMESYRIFLDLAVILIAAKCFGLIAKKLRAPQVEMLKSLNCNYAQGYYYAKPMPQAEFEKHVKQCCK